MKKNYIAPEFEVLVMNIEQPVATSTKINTSIDGLDYAGVGSDSDDPGVKADMFSDNPFEE